MNNSNSNSIILTRFLYIKDEVEIALLMSILQKKKDSMFWAYELYFSGFEKELFEFIWIIYYDFFATMNPLFEKYIIEKETEWLAQKSDVIIGQIVENLLIRPFTCDVYLLQQLNLTTQEEEKDITFKNSNIKTIIEWLTTNKYNIIANYIFSQNTEESLIKVLELFIQAQKQLDSTKKIKKIKKQNNIIILKRQIVSRVLETFQKKTKGTRKQFYMIFTEDKVEPFKNVQVYSLKPYRILPSACKHGINDHEYLSLFKLNRDDITNLLDAYHNNWLFYASFSPIWFNRIHQHNGIVDYEKKQILFTNDDDEELFNNSFNYEPDEQSLELKEKTVPDINSFETKTWVNFQEIYNINGLLTIE